jgi:hypothetical protein
VGRDVTCRARIDGVAVEVRALLETDEVVLRGEHRRRIAFSAMEDVSSADGWLRIVHPDGTLELALGGQADAWCQRIQHPPSLLDKMGLRRGQKVAVVQVPEDGFVDLVAGCTEAPVLRRPGSACDMVVVGVATAADLGRLERLKAAIVPDGAIWVVHPKGRKDLRDVDVIAAGRAAGLVDNKVTRFSDTHSALRFVIPRAQRPQ